MKLKFILGIVSFSILSVASVSAQKTYDGKVLKEVKEWKIVGNKRSLDHVSRYDAKGNKTEEIEYDNDGKQKSRSTFEYNEAGKCVKEVVYDENNKVEKTISTEYNEKGKKKGQTTFQPNGKVKSKKEFEYVTE